MTTTLKKWMTTGAIAVVCGFASMAYAAGGGGVVATDPTKHFHPKRLQNQWRKTLPFDDQRDFEEQKKGFIASPDYKQIMAEAGHVAWDMGSYEWLLDGKDFDSIHPSLQRQAILNMNYGLY